MRFYRYTIIIAIMSCEASDQAKAFDPFDYHKAVAGWYIQGWRDPMQESCGASTVPELASPGYFAIYQQLWPPSAPRSFEGLPDSDIPIVGPRLFWGIDFATSFKADTSTRISVDVDKKFHADYPEVELVERTTNSTHGYIGLTNEECAYVKGCDDKDINVINRGIASEIMNARHLTFTIEHAGKREVRDIDVSRFQQARKAIDVCLAVLKSQEDPLP